MNKLCVLKREIEYQANNIDNNSLSMKRLDKLKWRLIVKSSIFEMT